MSKELRYWNTPRRLAAFTFILLLCLFLCLPWFMTHKGKSTLYREASGKVKGLLVEFWEQKQRWPESMPELVGVLKPDLSFESTLICESHPWNHREPNTLEGAILKRAPQEDFPDVIAFDLTLQGRNRPLTMFVPARSR